jgi:hypothetical protein
MLGNLIMKKQDRKRGRKKGQGNQFCVLPTCSRCYERLHDSNGYKRTDGLFTSYCRACNTEVAIINRWRKKSYQEIDDRIKHYDHMIELLFEASNIKMGVIKRG